jgi:hypothetical protein
MADVGKLKVGGRHNNETILGEIKFKGVNRSGVKYFEASMALKISILGLYPEEVSSMLVRKTIYCRETGDHQAKRDFY